MKGKGELRDVKSKPSGMDKKWLYIAAFVVGLSGCGIDSAPYVKNQPEAVYQPSHTEQKMVIVDKSKFETLMERLPNLALVSDRLKEMVFIGKDGEHITGYRLLFDFLDDGYDPTAPQAELKKYVEGSIAETTPNAVYLLRVAQMLWVEDQKIVPWTIEDYTEQEIQSLLAVPSFHEEGWREFENEKYLHQFKENRGFTDINLEWFPGNPGLEKEAAYTLFPIALKLLDADQHETTVNLVRWIKGNVFHAYTESDGTVWGWNEYRQEGIPARKGTFLPLMLMYPVPNLNAYFEERISGCHEPVLLLANMARALNIPAQNMMMTGHGITYLPLEEKYIHGDHLSNMPLVGAEQLFLEENEFATYSKDSMLSDVISNKVKSTNSDIHSWKLLSTQLGRKDSFLKINMAPGGNISEALLSDMKKELPQFNIRLGDINGDIDFDMVPIQTFDELRDPTVKI